MTPLQIYDLEMSIFRYNGYFGIGAGEEISGALMLSHSLADQIKVFEKAKSREIILEVAPDSIDGIIIKYKRPAMRL